MAGQRVAEHLPAFLVGVAQATHQGVVVSEGQEQRYGALVVRGRMAEHEPSKGAGLDDQLLGSHHVAEPQPRRKGLGQAAHVDDPVAVVEALQGRRRLAHVVELALVVVLDDHEVRVDGASEQLVAPLERHGHGGG